MQDRARPTVNDIAREAGVSLATVDRVLNDRPGVRLRTVEAVNDAIRRIGYVRDVAAANLARQRIYRFAYVLPDVPSQFVAALRAAVGRAATARIGDRADLRILTVPPRDPHAMVVAVEAAMEEAPLDGVAIMAHETPEARDLILRLKERRVAVVALITDQPKAPRDHFVGIDNIAAGRTAGMLLGRFAGPASGRVAVVVSSMLARDMVERRQGFDAVLAARFPHLHPLPSVEGHDDRDLTARVTAACLDEQGPVVGVYVAGAGARGVIEALRGINPRPVVIAHELTRHTRAGLAAGSIDAVIAQDVGHIARSSLRLLRAAADGQPIDPAQERIRISILLHENLPPEDAAPADHGPDHPASGNS